MEDLNEFHRLAETISQQIIEQDEAIRSNQRREIEWNDFAEKLAEQIDIINQKGQILLQSSTKTTNPIEEILEKINRSYENFMKNIENRLMNDQNRMNDLRLQLEEIDGAMNEFSEILVAAVDEIPSAQLWRLTEQFDQIRWIRSELEQRKEILENILDLLGDFDGAKGEKKQLSKLKEKHGKIFFI